MRSPAVRAAATIVVGFLVLACASTPSPSTTPNSTASPVGGTPRVVQVAAGSQHTCVLRVDGGVKCWGSNAAGELGNGTTKQTFVPGAVDVVGLAGGVSAISAGNGYTCALTNGGGVKCWGYDAYGQLGSDFPTGSVPADVVGLSGVLAVDVNGLSCAITGGGGVKCWGANHRGQLGNSTTTDSGVPVSVSGLASGISAISVGGEHACALTSGGAVKCWGSNGHGQLGDNSPNDSGVPVNVSGLSSGVRAIASGQGHTCALLTGGTVKCWGNWRILGNTGEPVVARPAEVAGLEGPVSAIAAGGLHTCALMDTGGVQCWGYNEQGQLGTGTTTPTARPDTTPPPNPGAVDVSGLASGISAISAGENHTCAITSGGEVKCWGYNFAGQLNADEPEVSAVPMTVDTETPPSGPPAAALPVHGSAREMGEQVLMAPGPNGTLYVAIPRPDGSVVALLDRDGRPRSGWPIRIGGAPRCGLLLPVHDGSVRVVCNAADLPGEFEEFSQGPVRAFAFDAGGRPLAGWPVDIPCCFIGRVLGDTLTVYGRQYHGDTVDGWIVSVAADGTVRNGARVTYAHCCEDVWTIGPDGVAYGVVLHFRETIAQSTSELTAVSPSGVPAGFPVAIDGNASEPAFDAAGRIHVIVGVPWQRPARTLVFNPDGRAVDTGSGPLDIAVSSEFAGIEGTDIRPVAPLVGANGTTFLIETFGGRTTVAGVGPAGQVMAGWPYRSDAAAESTGFCPDGAVCEGSFWALPAIGPGHVIYLIQAAAHSSVGGSVVAVGPDARVLAGWPVVLQRPGGEFWSTVVGSEGTAYTLAIEPEAGDEFSASILAFAPDSTVLWTTTIIDP